jgi:thioredoxin-like negative regulator of GroEL
MKANPHNKPIIEIGEANFESEVLRWKQSVLVAFSAAWSRPCQILNSVLGEVAPFGWPFRSEFSLLGCEQNCEQQIVKQICTT